MSRERVLNISNSKMIEHYWKEKMSLGVIARKYGVSVYAVWTFMVRNGIDRRTMSEAEKVAKQEGRLIIKNIEKMTQNSPANKHGWRDEHTKKLWNINKQEISNLYNKGFSVKMIAKKFEVTKGTVLHYMKENGIERRIPMGTIMKGYNLGIELLKEVACDTTLAGTSQAKIF